MKRTILILMIIIFIFIAILISFKIKETKGNIDIAVVKIMNSEQIKTELKNAMKICEEDYKEGLSVNPYYTRSAFYNDTRLSLTYYDGTIKFVNKLDLYVLEDKDFFDSNGNKVSNNSELASPMYKGEEVKISDYYKLEVGKYYLVKYQKYGDTYSYCFIGKMVENGFEDFELYCVIEEDLNYEEMELESNEFEELESYRIDET